MNGGETLIQLIEIIRENSNISFGIFIVSVVIFTSAITSLCLEKSDMMERLVEEHTTIQKNIEELQLKQQLIEDCLD